MYDTVAFYEAADVRDHTFWAPFVKESIFPRQRPDRFTGRIALFEHRLTGIRFPAAKRLIGCVLFMSKVLNWSTSSNPKPPRDCLLSLPKKLRPQRVRCDTEQFPPSR